ncbi:hypothetical protein RAA17_09695 [Komagataeibacter rhaeticus]|nr:hypothetical protein [Komagataeibacter rhaeticus]
MFFVRAAACMRTHNAHLAASCMHGGPAVEKGRKDHFSVAIDIRLQYQKHSRLSQTVFPTVDFPAPGRENSCGITTRRVMPHFFLSCRDHVHHE